MTAKGAHSPPRFTSGHQKFLHRWRGVPQVSEGPRLGCETGMTRAPAEDNRGTEESRDRCSLRSLVQEHLLEEVRRTAWATHLKWAFGWVEEGAASAIYFDKSFVLITKFLLCTAVNSGWPQRRGEGTKAAEDTQRIKYFNKDWTFLDLMFSCLKAQSSVTACVWKRAREKDSEREMCVFYLKCRCYQRHLLTFDLSYIMQIHRERL